LDTSSATQDEGDNGRVEGAKRLSPDDDTGSESESGIGNKNEQNVPRTRSESGIGNKNEENVPRAGSESGTRTENGTKRNKLNKIKR